MHGTEEDTNTGDQGHHSVAPDDANERTADRAPSFRRRLGSLAPAGWGESGEHEAELAGYSPASRYSISPDSRATNIPSFSRPSRAASSTVAGST